MAKASILLVDDEEEFADLLSQRLATRDFEVRVAHDGDQAMAALDAADCDVVLLDVGLPGKNGIEVLGDVKAMRPFTQVVMLTGQSSLAVAVAGMKHGAFDYLLKPADIEHLCDIVMQAKGRKISSQESLRMMDTEKMASLGVLAEGVAHEINNPVNIMVQEAGWIEDLLDEQDPAMVKSLAEIKSSLSQIAAQGKRCREITHKLLSLCGKIDPRAKDVNLAELCAGLPERFSARIAALGANIETACDPDLPVLRLPAAPLTQALSNLIDNALDAVEAVTGEKSIRLDARAVGENLEITVRDTGPGMDPQTMARIYEPFFSTKEVGKGAGLGLSIAYSIASSLGGTITAHSAPDQGATFTLRLPMPGDTPAR
jgi:two-component system, NtrC family, sensor kinase